VLTGAASGAIVGALQAVIPEAEQATEKLDETKTSIEKKQPGK
jgi:predicted acylesterase/phospholipase RssA